jgi:uncharacterized protein (TIGR04141 family)
VQVLPCCDLPPHLHRDARFGEDSVNFMPAEKISVSVYRLRAGGRASLEDRFVDRTPLRDGLDGWFHLLPPSEKAPPWFLAIRPYLGRPFTNLQSLVHGALALVCRQGVDFVLAFGFGWIVLDDAWLEPEFGRRVVLNAVPTGKILELNFEQVFARRHVARERSPKPTAFSAFGVELDRDLVSAVEGIPTDPVFAGTIRGATSLRLKITLGALPAAIDKAEALFASDAYLKRYPAIDSLRPIMDDSLTAQLDDLLDADMKSGKADRDAVMCAPSFRRGEMDSASAFVFGRMAQNPATSAYLEYSGWKYYLQKSRGSPSVDAARETRVHMLDHDGTKFDARSVYECLGYELALGGESFILSSGLWYRADGAFTKGIDGTIAKLKPTRIALPACKPGEQEGPYNARSCAGTGLLLMDKRLVHFGGNQSKFEFCDFMHLRKKTLFCAKIPTASSDCSHLTEQSRRTLELFFSSDPEFRRRAKRTMAKYHPGVDASWLDSRPKPGEWKMCLVLMRKTVEDLPLFARCSIARLAKYCDEHGHPFHVQSV